MKIVILGGTGLIGKALQKSFSNEHQVHCFNREAFQSFEHLASLVEGSDFSHSTLRLHNFKKMVQ